MYGAVTIALILPRLYFLALTGKALAHTYKASLAPAQEGEVRDICWMEKTGGADLPGTGRW